MGLVLLAGVEIRRRLKLGDGLFMFREDLANGENWFILSSGIAATALLLGTGREAGSVSFLLFVLSPSSSTIVSTLGPWFASASPRIFVVGMVGIVTFGLYSETTVA